MCKMNLKYEEYVIIESGRRVFMFNFWRLCVDVLLVPYYGMNCFRGIWKRSDSKSTLMTVVFQTIYLTEKNAW